ncbi:MAG: hypothetical protein Q8R76_12705 [Candidatus Omnitrophota bacterium]|nr:hypothetical protein [Candidatus Omnitrophota bacterium]
MSQIYFRKRKEERGVVLVGTLGLLVFLGLFGAVGTSVTLSSVAVHATHIQGTQSLAIADAGAEWYLEQLEGDADWTNEVNQTLTFAEGSFTISIAAATAAQVTFTSTGSVVSPLSGVTVQRTVTMTAEKLPPAFKFALYQGRDPGSNFRLTTTSGNHTTVTGDMWSRGVVRIDVNNSVTGTTYVADSESVIGAGTYTAKLIAAPYLSMPVIDATAYTTLISGYNALLDANSSTVSRTLTNTNFDIAVASPDCSGSPVVCNFRNFTTRGLGGTVNITGNGTICINRTGSLHNGSQVNSTSNLVITPDAGGSITVITNRNLNIGKNNNPTVSCNGNCTFYSRTQASNQRLRIFGQNTSLNDVLLMSNRRVTVQNGADIGSDSVAFVNYAGDNSNNRFEIFGAAGVTTFDGTLISLSRRTDGLTIRNGGASKANVSVTGLVYERGTATTGGCFIEDASVSGSVVCNVYQNNRIRNAAIIYSTASLPSTPPAGFENSVSVQSNSWDGL